MRQGTRTAATLAGLGLLLVVAAAWGWSAVTAPFPQQADPPVCVDQQVQAGDRVFRDQVTVSVLNASRRAGLAGATSAQLEERGFHPGSTGNAPDEVKVARAQIWATDASNPAVRLVRKQLHGARVVRPPQGADVPPGVALVLGDRFRGLTKGRAAVRAGGDATVCGPPDAG
jgi:hypothetical protein